MRFSLHAATCMTLVSRAFAQTAGFDPITAPTKDQVLVAGTNFTVTWTDDGQYDDTVSIYLLHGTTPQTLQVGDAIGTGIDNEEEAFEWKIDASLGADATYGLKISLDGKPDIFQYSFPFRITPATGAAPTPSTPTNNHSTGASTPAYAPATSQPAEPPSSPPSAFGAPDSYGPPPTHTPPATHGGSSAPPSSYGPPPAAHSQPASPPDSYSAPPSSHPVVPPTAGNNATVKPHPVETAGAGRTAAGCLAATVGLVAGLFFL